MLRIRRRVSTVINVPGTVLSVSHGLYNLAIATGVVPAWAPDFWNIVSCGVGRGAGRFSVTAVGTNRICIRNTTNTTCTCDVFCWVFQGRTY